MPFFSYHLPAEPKFVVGNIEEKINILQNLSCNSLLRGGMLILLALISKQFTIVM